MKKLIIVESPHKAKTIQKYLGQDYVVMASSGHICDLPQKTLGIDVEHRFQPQYEINQDKKDIIKKLKAAVKQYPDVYLATDPDREGEAISWHLKNVLEIPDGKNRATFNEITGKAVTKALQEPREIDMNLVNAQQARRVLDRLVGYKISPILSNKIKANSSAGRVQSAALEMIVKREREIRDFKPEEYWNIFAFLLKDAQADVRKNVVKASFADIDGQKCRLTCKEEADAVLDKVSRAAFAVDEAKKSLFKAKPQPPFTTSTMQQDASHKLNMSAPQTMQVAQQLYEGVEIEGEGVHALVTYIRTDSVRISPEMQGYTLKYIREKFGEEYAPKKPNFYKTKSDAQDAHEAIRPISLERTPESLQNKINRNQYRLYKLIYERYLASQMTEAVYNTLSVHIRAEADDNKAYGFKVNGKAVRFPGYTVIYNTVQENEEDDQTGVLPDLAEGDKLTLKELKSEQKFTKPPSRYTDASLIKALEENGIGRPSTYASIISVLDKRAYTQKENKAIVPTPLGEAICDYMVEHFPEIMDLQFTAKMEGALDMIETEGMEWQRVIESFYPKLIKRVAEAGRFGNKVKMEEQESDVVCEKCGAKMVVRDGKYGKFLACPNFPKCRNIKPINQPVAKCPKCGKDVYKRTSRTGKVFYGCSGFPDCDFLSWDLPAPYLCPECGSVMKVSKLKTGVKYTCVNKNCNHSELVKQ